MGTANGGGRQQLRRWWIAFCSGWWLAGLALGVAHGADLASRPGTTTLVLVVVPLTMGVLLPGVRPLLYAAESLGIEGLPVGFRAILIGAVVGAVVWTSLPLLLYDERRDSGTTDDRPPVAVAAVPYVAAWPGISYLRRTGRRHEGARWVAVGTAIATAMVTYLVGAACLMLFGLVFL